MVSDSILRTRQSELTRLRTDLSKATSAAATSRSKASKATQAATSTRNDSTRRSKLSEAGREEKKALDADKNRGQLEKRIAEKEKAVFEAQRRYDKEVDRDRQRERVTSSIDRREHQFFPTASELDLNTAVSPTDAGSVTPSAASSSSATSTLAVTDVFISHASEDKEEIARPLKDALESRGVRVWFDELSIGWGEPIHTAVGKGIANARFGLVIISPSFMKKKWTNAELDALFSRQMGTQEGHGLILPLWHRVTADEVQARLPMIAPLKAVNTAVESIEGIAQMIADLISPDAE